MEQFQRKAVVASYINLEKQLLSFMDVVPLESNHLNVWSPQLVTIILEAASQLDSLLRYCTVRKENGIFIEHASGKVNILTHYKNHKDSLSHQWVVCWGDDGYLIQPFKVWIGSKQYQQLFWWDAYNKIKHDRVTNMKLGTLRVASYVLAALYLAIVNSLTLRRSVESSGYFNGDHCSHDIWLTCPDIADVTKDYAVIESQLFSHPIEWCDKKVDYFDEWQGDASMKFRDWFRRYNTHLESSRREMA
ncbi:hypothetical protein [Shewanella khirikhana]|uniref:Uncharacterized protein n=1 Tax=Shewanella khirikhana TaxID=1965282 RepID=A0ABN5TV06_9GAMM|nr:hypothetical protein [Shewanella khirikhana]AZQ11184.1 hypothetical protein STH12_02097 [Shewanella khirikhana]